MVEHLAVEEPTDVPVVDWCEVREHYVAGTLKIEDLCERFGVSEAQIRYRRETEGWPPRLRRRTASPEGMLSRLFSILDIQIRAFEARMRDKSSPPGDKDAMLIANMAKTLEKLLELDRHTKGKTEANTVPPIEDLREQLAERLERLRNG